MSSMESLRRTNHRLVRSGRETRALLDQPIKELAPFCRMPAIESERVFIEIVFELLGRYAAVEGAQEPSLEQRGDAMDPRQLFVTRSRQPQVLISVLLRPAIGPGAIADDSGTDGNILLHEVDDGGTVFIRESGDTNPADTFPTDFSSDYHDFLCLPRGIPRSQPTDQSLINFDFSAKLFASRANHRPTQFMQHRPGCLIAWQPEKPLESHRIDTHFLVSHPPDRSIPQTQGYLASMKDSSGHGRGFCSTTPTMENTLLGTPCVPCFTPGTDESFRPANPLQVFPA